MWDYFDSDSRDILVEEVTKAIEGSNLGAKSPFDGKAQEEEARRPKVRVPVS